jgi:hypothetical protein
VLPDSLGDGDASDARTRIIVVGRVRISTPLWAEVGNERTLPLSLRNGYSRALRASVNSLG